MAASSEPGPGKGQTRAGWLLSGLFIAFMLFDGIIKLPPLDVVGETMTGLGWPSDAATSRLLGVVGLACTLLYALPRTAMLGAILLTGYLGGAIATQLRIGAPLASHTFFGIYLGLLMWGGLWLRSPAVRRVLPFASTGNGE